MYLRGHSNVAVTLLSQLKREVWLNSNNAFLHTSKWSNWRVSHLQGFLKRPGFTSNTIHGQTGLGRPLLYCKMWLPPTEKRDVHRLFLWDGMEEAEEEPCRRKHNLIICLCPEGKSSPGQLQSPSFALHQTKLCDPGESKHVVLTPADLCGTPQIIHKQRRNHTSLRGRLWVTVSEEILTDAFYLFYSNSGLFQLLRYTKWGILLHNKIISSDIKITIKIEIKNFMLEWLQCIHM